MEMNKMTKIWMTPDEILDVMMYWLTHSTQTESRVMEGKTPGLIRFSFEGKEYIVGVWIDYTNSGDVYFTDLGLALDDPLPIDNALKASPYLFEHCENGMNAAGREGFKIDVMPLKMLEFPQEDLAELHTKQRALWEGIREDMYVERAARAIANHPPIPTGHAS
jgi:hypothetical protein